MNVFQTIVGKMKYYLEHGDHERDMYYKTGKDRSLRMSRFYYNKALTLCDLLYFDLDYLSKSEYDNIRNHIFGI